MKPMKTNVLLTGITLLMTSLTLAGCGDSAESAAEGDNSGDDAEAAEEERSNPIARTPPPDSPFVPEALEGFAENIAEAAGGNAPRDVAIGINLKSIEGYWAPVASGANRALAELGIPGVVQGPPDSADEDTRREQQATGIQDQLDQGYDAIVVSPVDVDIVALMGPKLEASGLPVATVDSDTGGVGRDVFIATDNAAAGATSAENLLVELGDSQGTIIVFGVPTLGWQDGVDRTLGAADVLAAAGHEIVHVPVRFESELDTENLRAAYQGLYDGESITEEEVFDPTTIVGAIGMFANSYLIADVALDMDIADELKFVTFDFEPRTLELVRDGVIQATHGQRQYYMDYLSVYALYGMHVLGMEGYQDTVGNLLTRDGEFLDTGLDVITPDTLDEYNAFSDSLGL
jgi:ribose transport system substrate-binding protein